MKMEQLGGIAASIAITSLMVGGLAFAQTSQAPAKDYNSPRVSGLDKNDDGLLSKEEAAKNKRLAKQFDAIDANKDGKLAKDELRAHRDSAQAERRTKFDQHFKTADKDGDGSLTRAETDAAKAKHLSTNFEKIDANKDGKISKEEMQASKMKHHNKRPGGKHPEPAQPAAPAAKAS